MYGDYELLQPEHEQVYAYTRTLDGDKWLILLNFSERPAEVELPGSIDKYTVMLNNSQEVSNIGASVSRAPYQAIVLHLNPERNG